MSSSVILVAFLLSLFCCHHVSVVPVFTCPLSGCLEAMPHCSLRDQRDFEEFDEFVCERFRLLPPSSSISQINSLARRLLVMVNRRFEYPLTRSLMRECLLYQRELAILRNRYYFLMGEALQDEAIDEALGD